jgi:hypothetical protein
MNSTTLHINSRYRISGNSNRFVFAIKPGITDAKYFSIGDVKVPRTYYNINLFNNSFTFIDDVSTPHQIPLPVGNYNLTEFRTLLEGLMNAVSANVHTILFDDNTGKIEFTTDSGGGFSIDFTEEKEQLLGDIIGFVNNDGIVENDGAGGSIFSPDVVSFGFTKNLFVVCNTINTPKQSYYKNITSDNILVSVPVNTEFGGLIFKEQDFNIKYPIKGTNLLNNIDMSILDENGNLIELNGSEWELFLTIFW